MADKPNTYDDRDIVRRVGFMHATGPCAEMQIGAYRVRDPKTGEFSSIQFHMTINNMVLAVMSEEAAKLFASFVTQTLEGQRATNTTPMEAVAGEPTATDLVPLGE